MVPTWSIQRTRWLNSIATSPSTARRRIVDGVYPTNHAEHETVEITHGFNDWFECGFYIFTSTTEGPSWQWVGDHIRPRVAVPKKWHWPVGVSLSNEIGYQRRQYSVD